jgi:hypothetical protein
MTALASPNARPHRRQARSAAEEIEALWAMSRAERVAAMWRSELTRRQLSKWSSRAPHEVPLLGDEFAWIAMRTPEWAESNDHPHPGRGDAGQQEANR